MKKKLKTSIAFAKNLFTTGAIMETSRTVEIEICQHIPQGKDVTVVEYGMGHGNITREILSRVSENSKVYSFEVKKEFCEHVKNEIKDPRLQVICDGAESVKQYVKTPVHAIIASIPFSFFSKEKAKGIIQDSYDLLVPGAFYNQVLYTTHNFKKFKRVFDDCEIEKVTSRIPSEYIYFCRRTG